MPPAKKPTSEARPARRGASPATSPSAASAVPAASEAALHEAISRALLAGRLPPGTPLRERYLAEEFSVTRGAVRKVLLRLGQEGKLEMRPNRGAYVPRPSARDMEAVYGARKAVEAGVVALLARHITAEQLARLRSHVRQERNAARQGRRDDSVRLAGGFHGVLVEMLDNPELAGIVQRLVARTQMFVALFERARHSGCAPDEHDLIVGALEKRDGSAGAQAMLDHLTKVEERVKAHVEEEEAAPPLGDILRSAMQAQ